MHSSRHDNTNHIGYQYIQSCIHAYIPLPPPQLPHLLTEVTWEATQPLQALITHILTLYIVFIDHLHAIDEIDQYVSWPDQTETTARDTPLAIILIVEYLCYT